jgi:hypothetical protein
VVHAGVRAADGGACEGDGGPLRGKIDGRAVLTDPPPIIHTMKVPELLRAFPKVGKTKAARIAARTNTTTLPVGRCGNATRQRIKDLLP